MSTRNDGSPGAGETEDGEVSVSEAHTEEVPVTKSLVAILGLSSRSVISVEMVEKDEFDEHDVGGVGTSNFSNTRFTLSSSSGDSFGLLGTLRWEFKRRGEILPFEGLFVADGEGGGSGGRGVGLALEY